MACPRLAHFGRLTQKAAAHVYAPHMAGGKGLLSGFTFQFDTGAHGMISHVHRHVPFASIVLTSDQ
jgi:hypothetical protein